MGLLRGVKEMHSCGEGSGLSGEWRLCCSPWPHREAVLRLSLSEELPGGLNIQLVSAAVEPRNPSVYQDPAPRLLARTPTLGIIDLEPTGSPPSPPQEPQVTDQPFRKISIVRKYTLLHPNISSSHPSLGCLFRRSHGDSI